MVKEDFQEVEDVPALDVDAVRDLVADIRGRLEGDERLVSIVIASREVVYECKLRSDDSYIIIVTNQLNFKSDE